MPLVFSLVYRRGSFARYFANEKFYCVLISL